MTAWATLAAGVTVVLFSPSLARAAAPSFQGLGDLPGGASLSIAYDVSADGSAVVGASVISGSSAPYYEFEAFRWQNGVLTALGDLPGGAFDSAAFGVSGDGSVAVGWGRSENGQEAFLWDNGVMTGLGFLPAPNPSSRATAVSADGLVVVGFSEADFFRKGFRWQDGVMTDLGELPPEMSTSEAYDISSDGSVVVGTLSDPGNSEEGFMWQSGVMTGLGYLAGASARYSGAYGVSADGSAVVGYSDSGNSGLWYEAFRWENGVMTALGALPSEYLFISYGIDISADASVVVGSSRSGPDSGQWTAFIWTEPTRMLKLGDVLSALGVDLTEWTLHDASGVSDDGLTIAGNGSSRFGAEGWIATLPADWIEQVTYDLTVSIAKSDWAGWGTVDVEPNLARHFVGKAVTLTAQPNEGIAFKKWKLYDPNHPGDANHVVTDTNDVLTLVMTADREVVAVFKCAPGGALPLPTLLTLAVALCTVASRRRKGPGAPHTAQ